MIQSVIHRNNYKDVFHLGSWSNTYLFGVNVDVTVTSIFVFANDQIQFAELVMSFCG